MPFSNPEYKFCTVFGLHSDLEHQALEEGLGVMLMNVIVLQDVHTRSHGILLSF